MDTPTLCSICGNAIVHVEGFGTICETDYPDHPPTPASCPWTSADECATARERSVAGLSDHIPTCPAHS